MIQILFRSIVALAAIATFSVPAVAQDPTGLQVSGAETLTFSLEDLDALAQITITTTTIWTEGEVTFTGPSLRDVLDAAGIEAQNLSLRALNDYAIEMPAPAVGAAYPIIATRQNGAVMSVREKGPFWIIFPYDSDAAFQNERTYSQSIWQLDRIDAMD
jgi:hypothetical protein